MLHKPDVTLKQVQSHLTLLLPRLSFVCFLESLLPDVPVFIKVTLAEMLHKPDVTLEQVHSLLTFCCVSCVCSLLISKPFIQKSGSD